MDKLRTSGDFTALIGLMKNLAQKQMNRELLEKTMIGKSITIISNMTAKVPEKEDDVKQLKALAESLKNDWKKSIKASSNNGSNGEVK